MSFFISGSTRSSGSKKELFGSHRREKGDSVDLIRNAHRLGCVRGDPGTILGIGRDLNLIIMYVFEEPKDVRRLSLVCKEFRERYSYCHNEILPP